MTATDAPLAPADLGLDYAAHYPGLDPFPWQLHLADGRAVLLSADLIRSAVLPTVGKIREPGNPHRVPFALVPPAVLAAAKLALSQAGEDELATVLLRRRQIAHVWGVEDVVAVRPDLTDDQAWDVLREVERTMDADLGVTWRVLIGAAENLVRPGPGEGDGG